MRNIILKKILKIVIEHKRKKMYKKAKSLGYIHPEVINHSQELDELLNKFDRAS